MEEDCHLPSGFQRGLHSQSDVTRCLLRALRVGKIEVADWLEDTFHVMNDVTSQTGGAERTLTELCSEYNNSTAGLRWFLQHLPHPLQLSTILDTLMEVDLQSSLHLIQSAGEDSLLLTPEFMGPCLAFNIQPVPSSRTVKWVICKFNLQYNHINSDDNYILFTLMEKRKNRCAQWLLDTFDIPLSDVCCFKLKQTLAC
ncbi:hypothetical protein Pelo_17481 [Pelomyxa schiedti]|nr:hypothetical protein Pelo_17481 [Pelomyxa schiedti]